MPKSISFLVLLAATVLAQEPNKNEAQIWTQEKLYWEYVKANDLEKYRSLWNDKFLGWPSISSAPIGKDHITDWITANTSKGIKLKSYSLEQLAAQVTGDVAITHYRIKATWGPDGKPDMKTETTRITHTWVRTGDTWQILGGMSAPVNAEGL